MRPTKCFTLLFLSTLTFFEYGVSAQGEGDIKVAEPVNVNVNYPARVAVPIQFVSGGYVGPYDPMDPKGLLAAQHRRAKLSQEKSAQVVKSYVPPGVDKFVKKEGIKLAVKEGERFAFSHPAETADLVGIATKAKHLYHLGTVKVKKMEMASNH